MEKIEITELIFSYNMATVAQVEKELQQNLEILDKELTKINMQII